MPGTLPRAYGLKSPANCKLQAPNGSIVTVSVADRGDSLTVSDHSRPRCRRGSPASVSAGSIAEPRAVFHRRRNAALRFPRPLRRPLLEYVPALSPPGLRPFALASLQSFLTFSLSPRRRYRGQTPPGSGRLPTPGDCAVPTRGPTRARALPRM